MVSRRVTGPMMALGLAIALAGCGAEATQEEAAAPAEAAASGEGEGSADPIAQRQRLLEGMGDAFRAIRGEMEDGSPDFAVLAPNAETIRVNAAQIIDHFPAGTGRDSGADTEALPIIWEDPEGFAAAHQRLVGASEALVEAVGTGDVAAVEAAVRPLGASCSNCHDTYRLDQD